MTLVSNAPQTVALDHPLDVHQRLIELQAWQQAWTEENAYLDQCLAALDHTRRMDLQRGAQIARWQQRLRMTLVRQPFEIAPDMVRHLGYEGLRRHLAPQFASLSKAERRLWLNNFLFIMTPDLRALSDKLATVRRYRSLGQQRNFLLGGMSGMGKSTCLDWFAAQYPSRVEVDRNHVPIIKIDAPVSNHSPKPFFQRILLECGLSYTRGDSEEELLMKMALAFQRCGTELLIVDEIEHITSPSLRRRLLEVSNLTRGLPIVCASCRPLAWVNGDVEVAGRWNDYFELRPYTGERLRALLVFLELLLPFTQPSDLASVSLLTDEEASGDGPARLIERWTGGILRDIMILVIDASQRAIEQGLQCLPLSLLHASWQAIQTRQVTDFLTLLPQERTNLP